MTRLELAEFCEDIAELSMMFRGRLLNTDEPMNSLGGVDAGQWADGLVRLSTGLAKEVDEHMKSQKERGTSEH